MVELFLKVAASRQFQCPMKYNSNGSVHYNPIEKGTHFQRVERGHGPIAATRHMS